MKKILVLCVILAAIFTVSACEKAADDSWTATVETLDPTNITAESACLNAKISWNCKARYAYEAGILVKHEAGIKYQDPGVICIRTLIDQLQGTLELHKTYEHWDSFVDTYYYVAYFRVMSSKGEEFIYGKEKSYHVPGK